MKIINIFAPYLYAIHHENDDEDAYEKALNDWQDVTWIKAFYENNLEYIKGNKYIEANSLSEFRQKVYDNAIDFDEKLEGATETKSLNEHFEILHINESFHEIHSKRKAKNQFLRLYGIKIDGLYIVTGGAIKLTQKMQDHPLTNTELLKLEDVKQFLIENQIYDEDSFYNYLIDQEEND